MIKRIVIALVTLFVVAIGVCMLFGDNLRRLLGSSADSLAGDDNIAQARPVDLNSNLMKKTMKTFGMNNTNDYDGLE